MEELLGSDAEPFFESYDVERKFGLRVNPLKRENVWMAEAGTPLEEYLRDSQKYPGRRKDFTTRQICARDAIRFMRQGHTIFRNQVPCPQRRH